ncbi:MAG TPA: hypothetical protein VJ161_02240 [Geobacteraceae bacterium]|nr:hypothetical protein [Geobacteraceae bacterium]
MKRRRSLIITLLLITPLVLLLLLVCLAIEREPLIVETAVPTVDSALRARNMAKNVLDTLNDRRETASIMTTDDDLNALMTLVGRGDQRFAGRVRVSPEIMYVKVSLRLPANPLGRYLNLQGELIPDERGLNIKLVKVGKLGFPRPLATALLKSLLNLGLGNSEGTALMESVQSLTLNGNTVTMNLRAVPQLKERLKRLQASLSRLHDFSRGEKPLDSLLVGHYYGLLLETGRNVQALPPQSLAAYLGPLFRVARERSATGDPVKENSAALLALAIYLGDPRFDKLAGLNLKPELRRLSAYSQGVNLGGRQDLRLHFVISAGLKLLTDQGISTVIGEFKELLDAGRGKSGFSFVDLAADRAGIRFAKAAADPNGGARRLQELLAGNPAESLFFPPVTDLPENLPREHFEQRYGGVDSATYNRLVRDIDRRIDKCPAYGGTSRR